MTMIAFIVVLLLTMQPQGTLWVDLPQRAGTAELAVLTVAGARVHGRLAILNEQEITLDDAGQRQTIRRTDVCRVTIAAGGDTERPIGLPDWPLPERLRDSSWRTDW